MVYNRSMVLERDFKKNFQKELKKRVKPVAILQYKQDATTLKGWPDTMVVLESIVIFIEYKKSAKARFQEGQKMWLKRLEDANHFTFVVYPEIAEDVLKEIERLK